MPVQARPLPNSGHFVVHESDAPLTVPVDPHLYTDVRAVERQAFDVKVAEKMHCQEVRGGWKPMTPTWWQSRELCLFSEQQ
jgi:hypothetical protein